MSASPPRKLSLCDLAVSYEAIRFSAERKGVRGLFGLKRRSFPVFSHLSCEISFDKPIVAIVGANGAGKTSLLRAIAGDIGARGSVHWMGKDLCRLSNHERSELGVTCVLHENGCFPNLSVAEHVRLLENHYGRAQSHFEELFERVKVRDGALARSLHFLRSDVRASELSGGERKILSLIRLLFRPWSLVLLDEPTAGLSAEWIEVFSTIVDMMHPACVLQAEQYSRCGLARKLGAIVYELQGSTVSFMPEDSEEL